MFLQQQGSQVLFKRSSEALEPAWVATCHDETTLDIWTLAGKVSNVTYGGGIGQWRMLPSEGHWVLDNEDVFSFIGIDNDDERITALESRVEKLELLSLTAPNELESLEERITALEVADARVINSVDSTPAIAPESPSTPAPVNNSGLE